MITARVKISNHQNTPSVAHRALTLVKGTSSKILKKTVIFHCKCIDINSYQSQVRALPSHYQNPSDLDVVGLLLQVINMVAKFKSNAM